MTCMSDDVLFYVVQCLLINNSELCLPLAISNCISLNGSSRSQHFTRDFSFHGKFNGKNGRR